MKTFASIAIFAAAVLVLSATVSAGTITIHDLTDNVLITDDTNGRVSFDCTGESCSFTITAPQGTAQISFEGNAIFNLREPPNLGQPISGVPVSETLFLTGSTTRDDIEITTSFQFISDTETGLSPLLNSQDLFEDGTAQPTIVIDYFDANTSFTGSDTIKVQSEIIEGRVPEPSTWLMALSGLALLGVPRVRRLLARAG